VSQPPQLVAVQPGGVRVIVQARTADMSGWRVLEQVFLDGLPVEPGHGAQTAGDGGPGAAAGLQVGAKHSMSARRAWKRRK